MTVVLALALGPGDRDVLESQLRYHLAAGVELVLVSGHSGAAIDSSVAPDRVRFVPSTAPAELARLARDEHDADWIVPARGGEFWWPHGGGIGDVLSGIAPRFGAVQALTRAFPLVRGDEPFAERMVYRLSAQAWPGDESASLRPARTYAHRPDTSPDSRRPLRGWYPMEVLSFPVRSDSGFSVEEEALVLDEQAIEAGLAAGTLTLDTRLRDALRALDGGRALEFPRPNVVESAGYAVDAAVLGEGEIVAAQTYLDDLEARLAELEGNVGVRLERKLRSLARRRRRRPSDA